MDFKTKLDAIRVIFFPKNFEERYRYVGAFHFTEGKKSEKWILPIVLLLDYKMRPKWCPQWFLRLVTYLATGWSIVRVQNRWIYDNVYSKITKGFKFIDWKTKWESYDLRISVSGDDNTWWLCEAIESKAYREGRREDMIDFILKNDSDFTLKNLSYRSYAQIETLYTHLYENLEQEKDEIKTTNLNSQI